MPKDLEGRMKDLSLSSESKVKSGTRRRYEKLSSPASASQAPSTPRRRSAKHRREHWVYGFHLKYRYVRRIYEKFGIPDQTRPASLREHLRNRCHVPYVMRSMYYRGRPALFLVFMEEDGRKQENVNRFTVEQMDRVRIELLLPDGMKPKWYSDSDNCGSYDGLSSEDEDMTYNPNEFTSSTRKEVVPAKPSDESTQKELGGDAGKYISDDDDVAVINERIHPSL